MSLGITEYLAITGSLTGSVFSLIALLIDYLRKSDKKKSLKSLDISITDKDGKVIKVDISTFDSEKLQKVLNELRSTETVQVTIQVDDAAPNSDTKVSQDIGGPMPT